MKMTILQKHRLKKIARKIVIQSESHRANIVEYYKILHDAAKDEFTEDNQPTLEAFLRECHEAALPSNNPDVGRDENAATEQSTP